MAIRKSCVTVFACLIFIAFSAVIDEKIPPIPQGTPPKVVDWGLQPKSLEGQYLLGVPSVPINVKSNSVTLALCNTHIFKFDRASDGNIIKVKDPISTRKSCLNSDDQVYINLITSISSFQVSGSALYLLSGKKIVAKATKSQGVWPDNDKLEGKWDLHLLKIPLTVTATDFSFKGCNSHNLGYTATNNGKISFTQGISTLRACILDTDSIYVSALLNSSLFVSRPLDFTLYGSQGDETAYAIPAVQ